MKEKNRPSDLKKNQKNPKKGASKKNQELNLCYANNKEVRPEYRD